MSIFKCSDCGYCFGDPRYSGNWCICGGCGKTVEQTTGIDLTQIKFFEELFEEKLKALCDKYDDRYGEYPESTYEGSAIYEFYQETKGKI